MRIERLDETTRKNLLEDLLKRSPNSYGTYEASVREILDEVKNRRDEAVFAYTEKFDGAALNADNIQVTEEEIQAAKNMTAYEYLRTHQAQRLQKTRTRNEWQLTDHDSFKINELSSKWHWKSRDIGGGS